MEDLTRALRAHPFFDGLGDAPVAVLAGCARNARFRPGELLLREGDPAGVFYLIRRGMVSLEVRVPGSPSQRAETAVAGDLVGLSWMFPPARVQLDGRALDDVLALALDGTCLRARMDADPALGYAIARRLLAATLQRLERVRMQRLDVYGVP